MQHLLVKICQEMNPLALLVWLDHHGASYFSGRMEIQRFLGNTSLPGKSDLHPRPQHAAWSFDSVVVTRRSTSFIYFISKYEFRTAFLFFKQDKRRITRNWSLLNFSRKLKAQYGMKKEIVGKSDRRRNIRPSNLPAFYL